MCCFREENCGKRAADAQVEGEDAAENGGKSAAVETATKDATGESATKIADQNQVVLFSYAALRCSPPLSERFSFVVMHTPLRCLPPRSM